MSIANLKSIGIFFVLALIMTGAVYAQESKFSFGLGGELNGGVNDTHVYKFGGGWTGAAEYHFNPPFSAGIKSGVTNEIGGDNKWFTVFEQSIFARWYFLRLTRLNLFAETDLGGLIIVQANEVRASLDWYLTVGVRIFLKNWYVEPYFGMGYPFLVKGGLMLGYRVPPPQPVVVQSPAAVQNPAVQPPEPNQRQPPAAENQASAPLTPTCIVIFSSNRIDFTGLDEETAAANNQNLSDIGNTLKAHPEYRVLLEGHANATEGTAEEEQYELMPLSRQRAEVVAEILIRAGVNRKQLIIAGSGGVNPSSAADKNRRVELTLMYN